eukprot:m.31974 g.31974  ORF g.31974 m.31974 type:complete len:592 (+) comp5439_c0_seq1:909-2684(+)
MASRERPTRRPRDGADGTHGGRRVRPRVEVAGGAGGAAAAADFRHPDDGSDAAPGPRRSLRIAHHDEVIREREHRIALSMSDVVRSALEDAAPPPPRAPPVPAKAAPAFQYHSNVRAETWTDKHSRCPVTLLHPEDLPNGCFPLGTGLRPGNTKDFPQWPSLVARQVLLPTGQPLLAPPTGARGIWDDSGSGARRDLGIFELIPPANYVALGLVAHLSKAVPDVSQFRCVHRDALVAGEVSALSWSDRGSRANRSVSVFREGQTGLFYAHTNKDQCMRINSGLFADFPTRLPDAQLTAAIDKFCPAFVLHPHERYEPSSLGFYMRHSETTPDLFRAPTRPLNSPSQPHLYYTDDQHRQYDLFKGDLHAGDARLYAFSAHKASGAIDLVYIVFYTYNRGKQQFGTVFGNHVGDLETVTIRGHMLPSAAGPVFFPFAARLHFHGEADEQPFHLLPKLDNTHTRVLVAEGSHGNYLTPGHHIYKRPALGLIQLADDVSDQGPVWKPYTQPNAVTAMERMFGDDSAQADGLRLLRQTNEPGFSLDWFNPDLIQRFGTDEWGTYRVAGSSFARLEKGPRNFIHPDRAPLWDKWTYG